MAERFTDIWTPQQQEAEASRIVAEGTPELLAWLASEGLELSDAGSASFGAGNSAWKASGLKAEFELWRSKAQADIVAKGVTGRPRVATRIVTRFSEARLEKSRDWLRPVVPDAALDGLPPELAWVARHPEVHSGHDPRTGVCATCQRPYVDPVVRAMRLAYEQENPAPNELALTLLRRAKDKPEVLDGLLKQHLSPKRTVEKPEDAERPAAQERLERIRLELAGLSAES